MRLFSEVLGALAAGACVFVVARQAGANGHRAYGAIAVVPIAIAIILALPLLNEDRAQLQGLHQQGAALNAGEAQLKGGATLGLSTEFFAWVAEHVEEGESFHLEIGRVPNELTSGGVGIRQAAILQWGMYQLAPLLAEEQSPKARDLRPGEGRNADWIVFYEFSPRAYPEPLHDVTTYAPKFAIARTGRAG